MLPRSRRSLHRNAASEAAPKSVPTSTLPCFRPAALRDHQHRYARGARQAQGQAAHADHQDVAGSGFLEDPGERLALPEQRLRSLGREREQAALRVGAARARELLIAGAQLAVEGGVGRRGELGAVGASKLHDRARRVRLEHVEDDQGQAEAMRNDLRDVHGGLGRDGEVAGHDDASVRPVADHVAQLPSCGSPRFPSSSEKL